MKPTMGLVMEEVAPLVSERNVDCEDIFEASAGIMDAIAEVLSNKLADFSRARRVSSRISNLDETISIDADP
jgi:hypothetical protein